MSESLIERSKTHWNATGLTTTEDIRTGCFQRIATATEIMANNYQQLIRDRDYYKRRYEQETADNKRMANVIKGLRGYIKRIKKIK